MGVTAFSDELLYVSPCIVAPATGLGVDWGEFMWPGPASMWYGLPSIQLPTVVALPLDPCVDVLQVPPHLPYVLGVLATQMAEVVVSLEVHKYNIVYS